MAVSSRRAVALFALACVFTLAPFSAARAGSLDIPSHRWGVSFGDSRDFSGLRLNLRDRDVGTINGVNVTFWAPHREPRGRLRGLSCGLLGTGAEEIDGLSVNLLGVGAERARGVLLGGLGTGADNVQGLAVGGLGVGTGRSAAGVLVGGLGCGTGADLKGIAIGGLGCGAGENAAGLIVGGLGAGAGEDFKGIAIGGLGVGAGEDAAGLLLGGLGAGAGENFQGLGVGGLGVGAGERFTGLGIGGLGVGAPQWCGVAVTGGYLRIERFTGLGVAPYARVSERCEGVTIAIFNWTRELHGVQLGLLNYAGNNPRGAKLLPGINLHFD